MLCTAAFENQDHSQLEVRILLSIFKFHYLKELSSENS